MIDPGKSLSPSELKTLNVMWAVLKASWKVLWKSLATGLRPPCWGCGAMWPSPGSLEEGPSSSPGFRSSGPLPCPSVRQRGITRQADGSFGVNLVCSKVPEGKQLEKKVAKNSYPPNMENAEVSVSSAIGRRCARYSSCSGSKLREKIQGLVVHRGLV